MKRVIYVLTAALVLSATLVGSARATTVLLDDYSTDKSSQYVSYRWGQNNPAATFACSDAKLVPTGDDANASGFYWNGGETLKPGDSVSVEFQISANVANEATYRFNLVGLALAKSTSSTNPWRIMGLRHDDGSPQAHTEGGGTSSTYFPLSASWNGWDSPSKMTITRGTDAAQNIIAIAFEQIGGYGLSGTGTLTLPGVSASDGLYFGTCNYKQTQASYSSWDNLAYTAAVPEPSTLVLSSMGMVGLMAYAWRKRK